MTLENKAAIITGSSRGIGRAVALRFARDGAKVVVNCVSTVDKAHAVAEEIRQAGGEAVVVQADVSKRADAERLIAEGIRAFGKVDILVSNAGIVIDKPFVESTDEDWARAIGSNLQGFFNVTRAVLPHMMEESTAGSSSPGPASPRSPISAATSTRSAPPPKAASSL